MKIGSSSHVGKVRSCNEDSFFTCDNFVVVADGMGGHNKGEVASKMAVDEIKNALVPSEFDKLSAKQMINSVKNAIENANKKIYDMSMVDETMCGMGTTVVVGVWSKKRGVIAYVGDSRCYKISKNRIEQLTCDHTLVQHMVTKGEISPEEAMFHKDRNIITRAVGTETDVMVDVVEVQINQDDILIFCSDGLSNYVSSEEMFSSFKNTEDLQETVDNLVSMANDSGGFDNITLVAVKF